MADIEFIRRLHDIEGWSTRKIAREFRVSRKTVTKYIDRNRRADEPYRLKAPRARPKSAVKKPENLPVTGKEQGLPLEIVEVFF